MVPRFVSVLWRKCEVEHGSLRPCFGKGQVSAHGLGKLARTDEAVSHMAAFGALKDMALDEQYREAVLAACGTAASDE